MRLLSVAFVTVTVAASGVAAQTAARELSLVQDLRIEAKQLPGLQRGDALLAIGPKGQIATTMRYGWMGIGVFDSTGKPLFTVATGRNDNSDIGGATALGWIGGSDTMWVADAGFGQLALLDASGRILKSIEYSTWIHPSWAERRKYPVFSRMDPLAVFGDQTMLIVPQRPRSLIDTPEYDRKVPRVLKTTWDGAIRGTVAKLPANNRSIELNAKGCNHTIVAPFLPGSFWAVSPDGSRISIIQPGSTGADTGKVRVTAIGERGDTLWSRAYPQPVERVTQKQIDDFLGRIGACGSFTADELRDSAKTRVVPFRSFVIGAIAGRDRSTWILTRVLSDTLRERGALIVDERGDVVGHVTLPLNEIPLAVDRDHYWTLEPGKPRQPGTFVRYRVQATSAPPTRSAPGGASSKPSRPPG